MQVQTLDQKIKTQCRKLNIEEMENVIYSSAKAARDLGYVPDDVAGIKRAIRASFEWFRRTGRIGPRARGRPPSDAARAVS